MGGFNKLPETGRGAGQVDEVDLERDFVVKRYCGTSLLEQFALAFVDLRPRVVRHGAEGREQDLLVQPLIR